MSQEPDYKENLSLMLSEVLDDIGVNERMVIRMRRMYMMKETVTTISYKSIGKDITVYHFGSQSEGTTTLGLNSDSDVLICNNAFNVIQDWSEWKRGKLNFLMIQTENTTPGYCYLQLLRTSVPLPETVIPSDKFIKDRQGRVLYKNIIEKGFIQNAEQHGPSLALQGHQGMRDNDFVKAFACASWPRSALRGIERLGKGVLSTLEMRSYAASTCCFVVPTGSKVSVHQDLEWRISTTLTERCLMFNLNITQIRCYILMKMFLKTFLNLQENIHKCISSFMCKTVLFRSLEDTEPSIWTENNLFSCFTYCLLELFRCVQNAQCPHFIVSENNLMAGQFNAETKHQVLKKVNDIIQSGGQWLLGINIDNVGPRLQVKMHIVPLRTYYFWSSLKICEEHAAVILINFANNISNNHMFLLGELCDKSERAMRQTVARLVTDSKTRNKLEHIACMFIAHFLFTTLGSALASSDIGQNYQVSHEALVWLSAGLTSYGTYSRLKLASVIYSTGDMEKTELILKQIERQYHSVQILPICTCFKTPPTDIPTEFTRLCTEKNEDFINHTTAFCVKFLKREINCVPRELQYEIFRSTHDDMLHRQQVSDFWMDMAVIDSLPYFYFLQYKTYGHLGRRQDKQQALNNLKRTVVTGDNLYHRETALNILGQCMEQENRHPAALKYYQLSLQQRARNNAAKIHICRLLNCIFAGQENEKIIDHSVKTYTR